MKVKPDAQPRIGHEPVKIPDGSVTSAKGEGLSEVVAPLRIVERLGHASPAGPEGYRQKNRAKFVAEDIGEGCCSDGVNSAGRKWYLVGQDMATY